MSYYLCAVVAICVILAIAGLLNLLGFQGHPVAVAIFIVAVCAGFLIPAAMANIEEESA
jgi:hypothetical protein